MSSALLVSGTASVARCVNLSRQTKTDLTIAQYVCRFLKPGKLDVGYTAHPSFVTEEELGAVSGPLSICASGKLPILLSSILY